MRFFILILILWDSVAAENLLPAPDLSLEPYKEHFYGLVEDGRIAVFEEKLKSEDLVLIRVGLEYRLGCSENERYTSYFAKLNDPIEASGDYAGLGIFVSHITLHVDENGVKDILPVLGQKEVLEPQAEALEQHYACE